MLDSDGRISELGFVRTFFDRGWPRPDRALRDRHRAEARQLRRVTWPSLARPRLPHLPQRWASWRNDGAALRNLLIVVGIVGFMVAVDAMARSAGY
jgi:hypothetical protein